MVRCGGEPLQDTAALQAGSVLGLSCLGPAPTKTQVRPHLVRHHLPLTSQPPGTRLHTSQPTLYNPYIPPKKLHASENLSPHLVEQVLLAVRRRPLCHQPRTLRLSICHGTPGVAQRCLNGGHLSGSQAQLVQVNLQGGRGALQGMVDEWMGRVEDGLEARATLTSFASTLGQVRGVRQVPSVELFSTEGKPSCCFQLAPGVSSAPLPAQGRSRCPLSTNPAASSAPAHLLGQLQHRHLPVNQRLRIPAG